MARLQCLGSSSEGNCFILTCGEDSLILDAGISMKEVLKSLNYGKNFGSVRGCLVTHL
jgi:hypothetical protein